MSRKFNLSLLKGDAAASRSSPKSGFVPATVTGPIKTFLAGEGPGGPLGSASVTALAVFVVGAAVSCAAQLVTARIIGPDSYGVYAYVLAWVTLLGYFATLGFHVSLLRFIPAYQARAEWALARGVIRYSQRSAAASAIGIVLLGVCVIIALRASLHPELVVTFLIGLAAVPFLALHLIGASVVRAFGGIVSALAPERIVRDGLLLVIIATVFWGNFHHLDATMAMAATLLSSIVMLSLVTISSLWLRPPRLERAHPALSTAEWWRPTLPLTVIMIADNLMSRSAVIALGLTGNTRDAGIFAAALSIASVTALPRMAVATAFAPTVSALFARGDQAGLQSLSAKATCLSLLGTACVAVPLLMIAPPLLAWFGRDFVAGAPVVTVLVLGQVLAAAGGPQQHLITMTGHERAGAAIFAASAGSCFAACILMIDLFGMMGAAIAMTGALICWNAAMSIFIHRRLQLMPGLIAAFKAMPERKQAASCRT